MTRALLVAALSLAACGGRGGAPADRGPVVRLRLPSLDGGEIDTAAYSGRVVVLHLFTTASTASQLDFDQLADLHQKEPRRAVVIGVMVDRVATTIARAWQRGMGARYLLALADDGLRRGAGPLGTVKTVPTTVVLDGAGRTTYRVERPLERGELARMVAPLLGAPR